MVQPGIYIVYGSCGICKVTNVGTIKVSLADPDRLYYTLQPVYGSETIYTPVDSPVFMRPAITRQQAEELIAQIPFIREDVCMHRNMNQLREHYESSFQSHECEDLVQLIKSVYAKNKSAALQGKKVGQMDQQYMRRAEELLYGELAVALDIPREDVVAYIESIVKAIEAKASITAST